MAALLTAPLSLTGSDQATPSTKTLQMLDFPRMSILLTWVKNMALILVVKLKMTKHKYSEKRVMS